MSFDIHVAKRLGDTQIALDLIAGDGVTILFGPSGAGKTSVLNMVAGLLRPDQGTIRVAGQTLFDPSAGIDVPVERRRAGYVFQEARLFPHLKVRRNLTYGARGRALDGDRLASTDFAFLGIAPSARSLAAQPVGRRGAARGDRPRVAQRSGLPVARRTLVFARRARGARRSCR